MLSFSSDSSDEPYCEGRLDSSNDLLDETEDRRLCRRACRVRILACLSVGETAGAVFVLVRGVGSVRTRQQAQSHREEDVRTIRFLFCRIDIFHLNVLLCIVFCIRHRLALALASRRLLGPPLVVHLGRVLSSLAPRPKSVNCAAAVHMLTRTSRPHSGTLGGSLVFAPFFYAFVIRMSDRAFMIPFLVMETVERDTTDDRPLFFWILLSMRSCWLC